MPRGRPPKPIPSVKLDSYISGDLHERLKAYLWSELEGRIPHGKLHEFLNARIREFFDHQHLDLAPYFGQPSETFVISGTPEAIALIKDRLECHHQ